MANYEFPLGWRNDGGTINKITYWVAGTDAGKPVTGLNVGDLCYCVDTLKLYVAKSATAWGGTVYADYLVAQVSLTTPGTLDGLKVTSINNSTSFGTLYFAETAGTTNSSVQIPNSAIGVMAVSGLATSWSAVQTFTGVNNTPTSLSATTTLTANHNTIYATVGVGGITLDLPAAAAGTIGRVYYAFKVDSGVGLLTIAPNGTNTLNGVAAAKTVANQFNGCRIQGLSTTGWLVTSFTGL